MTRRGDLIRRNPAVALLVYLAIVATLSLALQFGVGHTLHDWIYG